MKTLLKNLLVPALASRPVSAIADRLFITGTPVFMLHRFTSAADSVQGHDPEHLDNCLRYLSRHGYTFISVEQIIDAIENGQTLPKRSIAFTMDDGFLDQATIAAPIFIKHRCPVTIFLISGMLDNKLWPWDDKIAYLIKNSQLSAFSLSLTGEEKQFAIADSQQRRSAIHTMQNWVKTLDAEQMGSYLETLSACTDVILPSEAPANYRPMSWQQARELEEQGVRLAPHTCSHRILSRLDDASSEHETSQSWQRLNEELASPSPVFCYPTGRAEDFTAREIQNIRALGIKGAVSTEATFINMLNRRADYLYRLPRFAFPDTFTDFLQYCSWIERAKTQILRRQKT